MVHCGLTREYTCPQSGSASVRCHLCSCDSSSSFASCTGTPPCYLKCSHLARLIHHLLPPTNHNGVCQSEPNTHHQIVRALMPTLQDSPHLGPPGFTCFIPNLPCYLQPWYSNLLFILVYVSSPPQQPDLSFGPGHLSFLPHHGDIKKNSSG